MSEKIQDYSETERGKYIVIEGPEAVGKSTQVEKLIAKITLQGVEARADIREPGGTPIGEAIREILKDKDLSRDPQTNLYLFNAARNETLHRIGQELHKGQWVVCDRNYWSTYAYQVRGEGLDEDVFEQVTTPLKKLLEPDATVFLMTSEEEQSRRLDERGDSDYFQDKDIEFHKRVRDGYMEAADSLGNLVDGEGDPDEVHERLYAFIRPLLNDPAFGNDEEAAHAVHTLAMQKYTTEHSVT